MEKTPLVSVSMITYSHESYIEEAINGVLMQETDFDVELVISNDSSPDQTDAIIQRILKKHPKAHWIKYIAHEKNIGMTENFINNLQQCSGKYIAICEGDDYWTDPTKLQRQTDFLENHQEYALVAENSIWHDLFNGTQKKFSTLPERDIGILELLEKRQFATASVLFRNFGGNFFTKEILGDTILWCHLTKYGKIKYMENVSSVYRRHAASFTGEGKFKWAESMACMIAWDKALRKNHPEINSMFFNKRNRENFKDIIDYLINNGLYNDALLAIDELIKLTAEPEEYKAGLFKYIEEILVQKEIQLKQKTGHLQHICNSLSFKIGRAITFPARFVHQRIKK
jgi:glycosyltransferase involved in cell wall biosynthesis